MVDKIIVGVAVWLATNPTGRKTAVKGFKVLSRLGNIAVRAMPPDIGNIFANTEKFVSDIANDEKKEE